MLCYKDKDAQGFDKIHLVTFVLQAMHHPFTAPNNAYLEGQCSALDATARSYDLVYNGYEIGGTLPAAAPFFSCLYGSIIICHMSSCHFVYSTDWM